MRNLSDRNKSYCSRMRQAGVEFLGRIGNGNENSDKRELPL
jgi:hypothetical protein